MENARFWYSRYLANFWNINTEKEGEHGKGEKVRKTCSKITLDEIFNYAFWFIDLIFAGNLSLFCFSMYLIFTLIFFCICNDYLLAYFMQFQISINFIEYFLSNTEVFDLFYTSRASFGTENDMLRISEWKKRFIALKTPPPHSK